MADPCDIPFGCRYIQAGGEREGGSVVMMPPYEIPIGPGGEREGGLALMTSAPPPRKFVATYSEQSVGNIIIDVPMGVSAGDRLLAFAVAPFGPSAPVQGGAWTPLNTLLLPNGMGYWIGWRIASTVEPPSYTWTVGVGGSGYGGMVCASKASVPLDYSINSGFSFTMTALSITSGAPDSIVVVFAGRKFALGPAGHFAGLDLLAPVDLFEEGAVWGRAGFPVGPTPNWSANNTSADDWVAFAVAMNPAP